jgi:hypothetical protein
LTAQGDYSDNLRDLSDFFVLSIEALNIGQLLDQPDHEVLETLVAVIWQYFLANRDPQIFDLSRGSVLYLICGDALGCCSQLQHRVQKLLRQDQVSLTNRENLICYLARENPNLNWQRSDFFVDEVLCDDIVKDRVQNVR